MLQVCFRPGFQHHICISTLLLRSTPKKRQDEDLSEDLSRFKSRSRSCSHVAQRITRWLVAVRHTSVLLVRQRCFSWARVTASTVDTCNGDDWEANPLILCKLPLQLLYQFVEAFRDCGVFLLLDCQFVIRQAVMHNETKCCN